MLTKQILSDYGFSKEKSNYVLPLEDVTIVVRSASWRGVQYFYYFFSINEINDATIPYDKKSDTIIEIKMAHSLVAQGYHKHELLFEQYTQDEYKTLLNNMLHLYFDPYKVNALQFLKDHNHEFCLTKKAKQYLSLA